MKKFYLSMLVIALFSFNLAKAQSCPDTGFATATSLFFIYNDAGMCANLPASVTVEGQVFNQNSCTSELAIYSTMDVGLTDPNNFIVDFGAPIGVCQYTGGTLSSEEFEMILNSTLNIYPNPITQGDDLNINLGIDTSIKVSVYSVTGKQMLATDSLNLNNVTVDISSLENGIYIAQIVTDLATITRKVIVMK